MTEVIYQFNLFLPQKINFPESLILSCGSNGELHKWKVTSNEFKPESSIQTQQKHILNKVTCHPNDVNLVLSGGQDGIIEIYDLRMKEKVRHCRHDAEEKVTDIQVSPVSGSSQFASGSDIGHTYVWDIRGITTMKISKYKPHVHEVHLDWHPEEKNWLATASKDRLIHVRMLFSMCFTIEFILF
jgi:WD40 repeat protein